LGIGSSLIGRLVTIDGRTCQYSEFHIPQDPQCPLCGDNPLITKPNVIQGAQLTGEHCHLSPNVPSPRCEPLVDNHLPEIDVFEFEKLRTSGADIRIIDVRSREEAAICAVPGYSLLPLSQLREKISTLPKDIPVILYCKTGRRSLDACRLCREYGLTNVLSLKDGILAWASAYLPEAPRY
jgi:adenylyltransferase/sulfurtransferase